jgi:hypothetical protein
MGVCRGRAAPEASKLCPGKLLRDAEAAGDLRYWLRAAVRAGHEYGRRLIQPVLKAVTTVVEEV